MKLQELSPDKFSALLAAMTNSEEGSIFVEWLEAKLAIDSYDPINPHNTSRNEGYRAAFRDILGFIKRGRDPKAYQEEAKG